MRSALFLSSLAVFTVLTGRTVLVLQPPAGSSSSSSVSSASSQPTVGCKVAGCSGQLCVDANSNDVVSTCEWKDAYACYQSATCERQSDGECGWTETEELNACLQEADGAQL